MCVRRLLLGLSIHWISFAGKFGRVGNWARSHVTSTAGQHSSWGFCVAESSKQFIGASNFGEEVDFKSFFQACPVAMALTGIDGIILDVNERFIALSGYTRNESRGRTTHELGIWTDSAGQDQLMSLFTSGGRIRDVEALLRHKNDETRRVFVSTENIALDGGHGLSWICVDTSNPTASSQRLTSSEAFMRRYSQAMIHLSQSAKIKSGQLKLALEEITETVAQVADVGRVGVWLFNEDRTQIRCQDLFERASSSHREGRILRAADYPAYFAALEENKVIVANDAQRDSLTREFTSSYLKPLQIASMLDAPIWVGGRAIGVVCCEQVGPQKNWTQEEELFASSMADFVGLAIGASQRHRAEQALQQSEERFASLAGVCPVGIFRADAAGRCVYVNDQWCEITGLSTEQIMGREWLEAVHSEDRGRLQYLWTDVVAHEKRFESEFRICGAEGIRWVLGTAIPEHNVDQELSAYVGTITDITKNKQAQRTQSALVQISQAANVSPTLEELLGTVHRELGRLIDATNFFVALYDHDKGTYYFPYCVDAFEATEQFSHEQLTQSLTDYVRRTGVPLLADEVTHNALVKRGEVAMVGRPSFIWLGVPLKTKQVTFGVLVVQSYQSSSVYSHYDLELLTIVSENVCSAIERQRASQSLRASEKRYRELVETSNDLIWSFDLDGRWSYVNPASHRILGYEPEELLGRRFSEIAPEEVAADDWRAFRSIIAGNPLYHYRSQLVRKDGTRILVSVNGMAKRDKDGEIVGATGTAADITEKVRAEEAARRAERLAALGKTVAGVAHELNNPLTTICGLSELLTKGQAMSDEDKGLAKEVQQQGRRCSKIVQDMLDFARERKLVFELVNIIEVVTACLRNFRHDKRMDHVDVDLKLESSGTVEADADRLEQVFTNIIDNALDALSEGSKDGRRIWIRSFPRDDRICIEISNSGSAIHDPSRVFDPFYTTKKTGAGTGLGLSLAYGIIQEHAGSITADNTPDGARFVVGLPVEPTTQTRTHLDPS